MDVSVDASTFWRRVFDVILHHDWPKVIQGMAANAKKRRQCADYDTGSVTDYEALCLLMLAHYLQAKTVIEVGTFIGMSTVALAHSPSVTAVYTCDISNDCLPATKVIRTYPKRSSTDMLLDLVRREVRADLCFFDGVLNPKDVDLLQNVTHPETVYAFHDYNYGPKIRKGGKLEIMPRKGIGNVQLLLLYLHGYLLIEPQPETTLALLVPEFRL